MRDQSDSVIYCLLSSGSITGLSCGLISYVRIRHTSASFHSRSLGGVHNSLLNHISTKNLTYYGSRNVACRRFVMVRTLTMVLAENKAKHLSSGNHTTKTVFHHHHHYHHHNIIIITINDLNVQKS